MRVNGYDWRFAVLSPHRLDDTVQKVESEDRGSVGCKNRDKWAGDWKIGLQCGRPGSERAGAGRQASGTCVNV